MKKLSYILLATALAGAAGLGSCTDDFEEVNTNPNKVYDVQLGDVWAGTVKRTADLIGEAQYNKLLNFSRSVVVQFCTNPGQDTGDSYFKKFYVDILRDLIKLERTYEQEPEVYAHRLAVLKTWKSYCFYMLASMYGPVPMSQAISDGSENKRYYKYDSEKEIYTQILADLKTASEYFDKNDSKLAVALDADPVYGGVDFGKADVTKWKRFCNTLRLNVAMHVQNLDPELSREHALAALDTELFQSNDDNCKIRFGSLENQSHSYYYQRFIYNQTSFQRSNYPAVGEYYFTYLTSYDDPRMPKLVKKSNEMKPTGEKLYVFTDTITRPHICQNKDNTKQYYKKCPDYKVHQSDWMKPYLKDLRDSIVVEYTAPYVPLVELNSLPYGWEWAMIPGTVNRYTDPLERYQSQYNPSFVQDNFVSETGEMVLLTYADACFLRAEAEMLYRNNEGAAKQAYEAGIMASMTQYGVADYTAFMNQDGVKWGTSRTDAYHDRRMLYQANILGGNGAEGKLEQIYKQRYLADFFMGLEEWNLERRTRVMNFPPFFANGGSSDVEGLNMAYNFWTERLIYPQSEISRNGTAYYEGIKTLQASSPFYRSERWGDNIFTSLGIAKKNPQLATADEVYGGYHTIAPKLEYFQNIWGETFDEVCESAKEYTGQSNQTVALTLLGFSYKDTKSWYSTVELPEPPVEDEE